VGGGTSGGGGTGGGGGLRKRTRTMGAVVPFESRSTEDVRDTLAVVPGRTTSADEVNAASGGSAKVPTDGGVGCRDDGAS